MSCNVKLKLISFHGRSQVSNLTKIGEVISEIKYVEEEKVRLQHRFEHHVQTRTKQKFKQYWNFILLWVSIYCVFTKFVNIY